jgi:hypothetical protein
LDTVIEEFLMRAIPTEHFLAAGKNNRLAMVPREIMG